MNTSLWCFGVLGKTMTTSVRQEHYVGWMETGIQVRNVKLLDHLLKSVRLIGDWTLLT